MTPQELKNSILQLTIQGKLVEQRPEEGTGEELYREIQRKKAALIKAGKIKKEKPLPEIKEDEIPFEIPESWKWVRLRNIVYNRGQETPNELFSYIDIGSIDNKRQSLNSDETLIEPKNAPSRARKLVEMGDIIYSTVRPYLHNICIIDRTFSHKPIASTGFAVMTCYMGMYNKFLFYYLLSPSFDNYANDSENAKGVAYPAINDDRLYRALIPLPPLAEQKRIVAKIEELLPYIDRYAEAWNRLEEFNRRFPEDLRKSILQLAIQGKLVEQRPEEGTGEELYERIQMGRKELERRKRIKNQPVDKIDENVPFDIPESWKWIRIGSVEEINLGFTYRPEYVERGIYFLSVKDISDGRINFDNAKMVSEETFRNAAYGSKPQRGDILFGRVGTMGKPQIVETDVPFCIFVSIGFFRDHLNMIDKKYVSYWMQSRSFDDQVDKNVKGSAQKNLNTGWLKNFYFPLPPLAEQKRIVEKVEELLAVCEGLR